MTSKRNLNPDYEKSKKYRERKNNQSFKYKSSDKKGKDRIVTKSDSDKRQKPRQNV